MFTNLCHSPLPSHRSSISSSSSEIVKRVEAALASATAGSGGETLTLTPPRSSLGSPERSLSPHDASNAAAASAAATLASVASNRQAEMSLPLRKRRVYHMPESEPPTGNDQAQLQQQQQQQEQQQQQQQQKHQQHQSLTPPQQLEDDDAAAAVAASAALIAAPPMAMRQSSVIQFAKSS